MYIALVSISSLSHVPYPNSSWYHLVKIKSSSQGLHMGKPNPLSVDFSVSLKEFSFIQSFKKLEKQYSKYNLLKLTVQEENKFEIAVGLRQVMNLWSSCLNHPECWDYRHPHHAWPRFFFFFAVLWMNLGFCTCQQALNTWATPPAQ